MADARPGTAGPAKTGLDKAGAAKASAATPVAEAAAPAEPSLGDLVASASQNLSVLVRSEIELAKKELAAEAKKAAIGGGAFGGAAFLGLFALMMLSFAAAYGINSLGLDEGWSFLIVAGAYLLIAAILVLVGVGSMKKIGPPKRTIKTTKDTVAVLKKAGRPAS